MKKFLSLLLVFVLILPSFTFVAAEESSGDWKLTVLHTNDTHAHLENVARLATAVKQAEATAENSLLLHAGDVFSGTLFFTKYNGLADLEFMHMLGYDAMTIGNHEFDKGPEGLAAFVKEAKFPIVSANIDFSAEPALNAMASTVVQDDAAQFAGKIYPAVILNVNGEKVGILGLTTEETKTISSPGKNIVFKNYEESARNTVKMLEGKGINKIIALSHLGYDVDQKLAAEVEGIDLIVGGHTHTKLDKPVQVGSTVIVQANEYTKFLGRVDLTFDQNGKVTSFDGGLIDVTKEGGLAEDPDVKAKLDEYQKAIDEMNSVVVGKSATVLDGERNNVRTKETNLGNLIADGMLDKASELVGATIAITNGGGIRASIDQGDITLGEVLTVMPFGNTLVTLDMTGEQILAALENGVAQVENQKGQFPHVAGMKFTYDSSKPAGQRVVRVEVKTKEGYKPLDPKAVYRVATNQFMADGGDSYASMKEAQDAGKMIPLGFVDYEVFVDYLKKIGEVNPTVESRIVDVATAVTPAPAPAPAPTPAPAPEAKIIQYKVKPGDVLWKIAKKYGMDWRTLAAYNKLKNPHLIFPNQIILIPVK